MTAFYNEVDPFAAQWLRNLIAAGHIAPGIIDERPIQEIEAWELVGFTQCHFFAGIGVWSYALRQAGWPDDRPIWTGSCPCQPFSNAGQKKGFSDDRHLWPYWQGLIDERKPSVVVGEQVASALEWIDLVSTDMEASGYSIGTSDLCAAGFDGAHIRQRNYFVGIHDTPGTRRNGTFAVAEGNSRDETRLRLPDAGCGISRLADRNGGNTGTERLQRSGQYGQQQEDHSISRLADDASSGRQGSSRGGKPQEQRTSELRGIGGLADEQCDGQHGSRPIGSGGWGEPTNSSSRNAIFSGSNAPMLGRTPVDWLYCRDGKWRPVEPGTFPLVDATPSRVGRLRAYGNALDAETATQFCKTVKEIADEIGV